MYRRIHIYLYKWKQEAVKWIKIRKKIFATEALILTEYRQNICHDLKIKVKNAITNRTLIFTNNLARIKKLSCDKNLHLTKLGACNLQFSIYLVLRAIHLVWFDRILIKLSLIFAKRLYKLKLTVVFEVSCVILLWREHSIVSSRHDLTEECTNILYLDDLERNNTFPMNCAKQWRFMELYSTNLPFSTIDFHSDCIRSKIHDFAQTKAMFVVRDPNFFSTIHGVLKLSNTDEHTNLLNRKWSNASAKVYRQPSDFIFCRVAFVVTWITKWRHSDRELVGLFTITVGWCSSISNIEYRILRVCRVLLSLTCFLTSQ